MAGRVYVCDTCGAPGEEPGYQGSFKTEAMTCV